jgi:hypothetical protein
LVAGGLTETDSERVLHKFYNGPFERRDRRAQRALDKVVERSGAFGKKR